MCVNMGRRHDDDGITETYSSPSYHDDDDDDDDDDDTSPNIYAWPAVLSLARCSRKTERLTSSVKMISPPCAPTPPP